MKQISILGCGWLGLPLAKSLLEKGYLVNGSTTSIEKIPILEKIGINPFIVSLSAVEVSDETKISIEDFLENSTILIIDIPPKLRDSSTALGKTFVGKIQNLIPFIEKSSVEKVIFVSSTSVYADDNSTFTEDSKPQPETESGKQLLESENLLQSNKNFQTTIIRFGGLIGEDRHPIKFLAGRTNVENPNAPINLIHQEDCIGIIEIIIEKGLRQVQSDNRDFNDIFNAVAPFHPTRKEYYTQIALELNLPLPEFDESKPSVGKLISSDKIESVLNYKFKNNLQ
ncbi:SDR family oxidoreductase [Flavobacterium sp. SUN052]|uniref:SDR family oxidoreductase n=1 Tax=Flavobacterium sp. SUN052 TaxID=3002441 RepID=UPI00237DDB14|nr:SDR family oxidoreductase [Flavobacterium sp. SUN052]MEC4003384.1 SDR family oxidoreductase [Flavobacterium sp. SUN052]